MITVRPVPAALLSVVAIALFSAAVRSDDPPPADAAKTPAAAAPKASDEDIVRWLADLSAAEHSAREQATEQLAKAGKAAVPGLAATARGAKLEAAIRAVQALRAMFEDGAEGEAEIAADALEDLAAGKNGIALRADSVLSNRPVERQQRAIRLIEQMGGEVRAASGTSAVIINGGVNGIPDDIPRVEQVLLGDDWKAGDDGLRLLRRLPQSIRIAVYVTPGCGVTQQALDRLMTDRPDMEVQTRGSAMLGISCEPVDGRLVVQRVQEGSGAAAADLQVMDVILKFEGEEIHDFQVIIDTIRKRKVGDKLTLLVSREGNDGKSVTSEKIITLGKWTLKDLKR